MGESFMSEWGDTPVGLCGETEERPSAN
jgi:hypothetical protein